MKLKEIVKLKEKDVKLKLYHKIMLFGFVGGIATVLDLLFFNFLFKYTSLFIVSRIGGIAFSMIWNFTANRHLTFQAKGGKIGPQIIKYIIVYGTSMGLNVLVGWSAYEIIGPGQIQANIAAIIGFAISIPTAFIGSWLWAFKTEKIKTKENIIEQREGN